jgi:hypothetical protein
MKNNYDENIKNKKNLMFWPLKKSLFKKMAVFSYFSKIAAITYPEYKISPVRIKHKLS